MTAAEKLHIHTVPKETEDERLERLIREVRAGKIDMIVIRKDAKGARLWIKPYRTAG